MQELIHSFMHSFRGTY